jgi:hypothetical protein
MKIAYICADPGVPVFGQKGCSIHVQEVIRALRAQGARVELFASRFGGESPPDLADVPVHHLPEPPKGDLASREQLCLAANGDLFLALESAGPFDLVYERYSLWSWAGMAHARAAGIPGLLEVNAPLIEEQAQHRGLIDWQGAEQVARQTFGSAAALLAVSKELGAYLEGWPAAHGRVHVVPNGVNSGRFLTMPKPACPSQPERIQSVLLAHLNRGTVCQSWLTHLPCYPKVTQTYACSLSAMDQNESHCGRICAPSGVLLQPTSPVRLPPARHRATWHRWT